MAKKPNKHTPIIPEPSPRFVFWSGVAAAIVLAVVMTSRLRQRMGAIAFIELMFLSMFSGESLDTGFDKRAGFAWTGIAVRLELSISQFVVIDEKFLDLLK